MRRWISILLPFVGLGLFAVIVVSTGPAQIAAVFRLAHLDRLAVAPLLVVGIIAVRGLRWWYILRSIGIPYARWRAIGVWCIGFFASAVTPAKAGDVVRAVYVRNDTGRNFGEAFVSVFVDRLWDLIFVIVGGVITVAIFSRRYMEIPSIWILAALVPATALALFVLTRRKWMRMLLRPLFGFLVPARHRDAFSGGFHSFYDSLAQLGRGVRSHMVVAALTLVCWAMIFALAGSIAWALEIPVSFGYVALIMPIVTLVELVPISISGLGTRDATVIYLFAIVGAARAQAVGFSLGYLIVGTYFTALIGFLLWLRHPVRLSAET